MRGHVAHDPSCQTPLAEHSGTEPCLAYVEDKEEEIVIAHYGQGPQGNQVADWHADYLARYGAGDRRRPLGSIEISDRRDNRDPAEVGAAHLARNNGHEIITDG